MKMRGTENILFSVSDHFRAGELHIAFVQLSDGLEICVSPPSRRPWRIRFKPGSLVFVDEGSGDYVEHRK